MHTGAEVDEPARSRDQGGQQVRCEDIDGEDMGKPVDGFDASRLAVADAGVMDHGVTPTERVHLLGDLTGALDGGQVPDHDVLGCR